MANKITLKIFVTNKYLLWSNTLVEKSICIFSYIVKDEYFQALFCGSSVNFAKKKKDEKVRKWVQRRKGGRTEKFCF